MFELHNLTPAGKKKKRVGRGGSRGGTSGRGHKGQGSRSGGGPRVGFEGGQMPLYRRLPKRGFTNARFKTDCRIVSLQAINDAFADGDSVNREALIEKGIIKRQKSKGTFLVKVLGNGELSKKVTVVADRFSKSALEAIKNAGGEARLAKEI